MKSQTFRRSRSSPVNSTCRLCPGHWNLHRDKCYWKSQHVKTWNQSRDDCLRKNAELLVIQDKEEMEFIKQSIEDKITYWIGLAFSVKKWMWVTGTQLDQNLFDEPIYTPNNKCGAVRHKILSEDCTTEFKWMCKKKSITLSF
ncbi:hypothetical protein JRQ81_003442 [Phrynocephalus forsythii]|uniref:C-type lectin domain-containing protein n=1 Tax=Phrynocephalus forsythii TaxID=171643 RepID=A0A9Q1AXG4_9SAUR|nr:hypothetical protein JRQ81_003442 [Phrynocephalus forsythii]